MSKKVVIALGGNAILQPNQVATLENQLTNVRKICQRIVKLIQDNYKVVITHGNGPQVGNILLQNELAEQVLPPLPLDVCNAQSQGFIGYLVEQTLKNELHKQKLSYELATLLTESEVDPRDSAFMNPTKPIGKFYTKETAQRLAREKNWAVEEDSGRGWRRVVPSPEPKTILNAKIIKKLIDLDIIVIAAGGGGIPVIKKSDGTYEGVEAVIDKDRSALKLAEEVEADILMLLTDVDNVYINYGKENQTALRKVTSTEARQYITNKQFAVGSMGPKVEAAISFAELGRSAIICSLENAELAIKGEAGTQIIN